MVFSTPILRELGGLASTIQTLARSGERGEPVLSKAREALGLLNRLGEVQVNGVQLPEDVQGVENLLRDPRTVGDGLGTVDTVIRRLTEPRPERSLRALVGPQTQLASSPLWRLVAMEHRFGFDLGVGNWKQEMLEYVYRRAVAKGKIVHAALGGYEFEYALIFTKDRYGTPWQGEEYAHPKTTFWLQDDVRLNYCGTNISGLIFVYGDSVPAPFRDYVGLHECVEARGGEHRDACRVELGEARKSKVFFARYAQWIHALALKSARKKKNEEATKGYFDRAVPDFTTHFKPKQYGPVEYVEMFYKMISE